MNITSLEVPGVYLATLLSKSVPGACRVHLTWAMFMACLLLFMKLLRILRFLKTGFTGKVMCPA